MRYNNLIKTDEPSKNLLIVVDGSFVFVRKVKI